MAQTSQWSRFKSRTTIQGFAEHDEIQGKIPKIIWVLFCLLLGLFCGQQLVLLFGAYFDDRPTTAVQMIQKVPLPDLTIALEIPYEELADAGADPLLQEVMYHQIKEADGVCPLDLDDEDMPDFEYVTNWTLSRIRETQLHYGKSTARFHELYRNILARTDQVTTAVDATKKGLSVGTITNSTIKILQWGPVMVFDTSRFATGSVDGLEYEHALDAPYYGLGFRKGGSWFEDDYLGFVEIHPTGHHYKIALSLAVYERETTYCDQGITMGMDCQMNCRMKTARHAGSCVPYLGDMPDLDGLRICDFTTRKECLRIDEKCYDKCKDCKMCQPCHEMVSTLTIEDREKLGTENGTEIDEPTTVRIRLANGNKVQLFHTEKKYNDVEFISQVGGIMGLCFGLSFVSIGHLVYYVYACVLAMCRGRRNTIA